MNNFIPLTENYAREETDECFLNGIPLHFSRNPELKDTMTVRSRSFMNIFQIFVICSVIGCATIDKGAQKAGQTGGKAVNVMNTTTEAGLKAMKEEPTPNPYNR